MKEIIDEIKSVPGIIGACAFSPMTGILANNLPGIFKEQRIIAMGKMMAKFILAGRRTFPDLTETTVCYEESALIMRELFAGTYLLVLAEPAFNASLLTMTLNLSLADIESTSGISAAPSAPAHSLSPHPVTSQTAAQTQHQAASGGSKRMSLDEMLVLPEIGSALGAMQTLLAKVLGPMAQIIFRESIEDWSSKHPPTSDNLPALVKILSMEIGDQDKIERYEQLISAHLSPVR